MADTGNSNASPKGKSSYWRVRFMGKWYDMLLSKSQTRMQALDFAVVGPAKSIEFQRVSGQINHDAVPKTKAKATKSGKLVVFPDDWTQGALFKSIVGDRVEDIELYKLVVAGIADESRETYEFMVNMPDSWDNFFHDPVQCLKSAMREQTATDTAHVVAAQSKLLQVTQELTAEEKANNQLLLDIIAWLLMERVEKVFDRDFPSLHHKFAWRVLSGRPSMAQDDKDWMVVIDVEQRIASLGTQYREWDGEMVPHLQHQYKNILSDLYGLRQKFTQANMADVEMTEAPPPNTVTEASSPNKIERSDNDFWFCIEKCRGELEEFSNRMEKLVDEKAQIFESNQKRFSGLLMSAMEEFRPRSENAPEALVQLYDQYNASTSNYGRGICSNYLNMLSIGRCSMITFVESTQEALERSQSAKHLRTISRKIQEQVDRLWTRAVDFSEDLFEELIKFSMETVQFANYTADQFYTLWNPVYEMFWQMSRLDPSKSTPFPSRFVYAKYHAEYHGVQQMIMTGPKSVGGPHTSRNIPQQQLVVSNAARLPQMIVNTGILEAVMQSQKNILAPQLTGESIRNATQYLASNPAYRGQIHRPLVHLPLARYLLDLNGAPRELSDDELSQTENFADDDYAEAVSAMGDDMLGSDANLQENVRKGVASESEPADDMDTDVNMNEDDDDHEVDVDLVMDPDLIDDTEIIF